PTALEAARPQPHLIREKLGDAALADAIEHQQGLVLDAAHHRNAVLGHSLDIAEPTAPLRLLRRIAGVARELGGDGMALAGLGNSRLEALLDNPPGRLRRQHCAERCAVKAKRRTEIRSRRLEQRAALLNVT